MEIIEEIDERIRKAVQESLGLATQVLKITQDIENEIIRIYDASPKNGDIEKTFYVGDLRVVFKHHFIGNEPKNSFNDIGKNGYAFDENTIYLYNESSCGEEIDLNSLFDSVQHEVEHYWQSKNSKKKFSTSKYQRIVDGMRSSNNVIYTVCFLLYLSRRIEIDAYVNGAYNILKRYNYTTYKEFIEKTDLIKIFKVLGNIENDIKNFKENTPIFRMAEIYVKDNGILNNGINKKKLLILLDNTRKYLYKKIGRAWAYYVKEGDRILTEEDIKKMNSFEKKIHNITAHAERMRLEGKENNILY